MVTILQCSLFFCYFSHRCNYKRLQRYLKIFKTQHVSPFIFQSFSVLLILLVPLSYFEVWSSRDFEVRRTRFLSRDSRYEVRVTRSDSAAVSGSKAILAARSSYLVARNHNVYCSTFAKKASFFRLLLYVAENQCVRWWQTGWWSGSCSVSLYRVGLWPQNLSESIWKSNYAHPIALTSCTSALVMEKNLGMFVTMSICVWSVEIVEKLT